MSDTIDRHLDNDPLAEEFFSQPPPPTETPSEHWEARPMSAGQRRAMRATFVMLLGLAMVTVCFAAYAEIAGQVVTGSVASARASLLLNLTDQTNVGHIPLPLVACNAETGVESPPGAHQAAVWAYVIAAGEKRPIIVEP